MWRIYYDDGKVITGVADIPPARRVGVIAVAEPDPNHNWIFWRGHDWYIFQTTGWWMGVDQCGLIDQILCHLDKTEVILQGRTLVPHEAYQDVIDRMMKECQPPKQDGTTENGK